MLYVTDKLVSEADEKILSTYRGLVAHRDYKSFREALHAYRSAVRQSSLLSRLKYLLNRGELIDFRPFEDVLRRGGGLFFPSFEKPAVSIIIPTFGQRSFTEACLRSLMLNPPGLSFEIIVVDDAYPDAAEASFSDVPGIRFFRNNANQGFLLTCNSAAAIANGTYLCFLNNDTEVKEGWLDELVAAMLESPRSGLVGSKLIYPDGRLQEAGGIVWSDASAWNYGHSEDPLMPQFNYVRRVDYCSGCSILISKELFLGLGGFDPIYAPAYYEDTDLCFRIRERGLEVYYVPRSVVVHYEGASHGTDLTVGVKAHQVINQTTFYNRWKAVLAEHPKEGQRLLRARDRAYRRPIILLMAGAESLDLPEQARMVETLVQDFLGSNFVVKYWHLSGEPAASFVEQLQTLGVEVHSGEDTEKISAYLHGVECDLDYTLFFPGVRRQHVDLFSRICAADSVFYCIRSLEDWAEDDLKDSRGFFVLPLQNSADRPSGEARWPKRDIMDAQGLVDALLNSYYSKR